MNEWLIVEKVGMPIVAMVGHGLRRSSNQAACSSLEKSFGDLSKEIRKEIDDHRTITKQGLQLELDHLDALLSERIANV